MASCLKFGSGGSSSPSTITINVYGAVNETIELGSYTCLTDENGLGSMEVSSKDIGKSYTPTCSVSGWSKEVSLSSDTYCRPANIIYWYGATDEITPILGAFVNQSTQQFVSDGSNSAYPTKNTNNIVFLVGTGTNYSGKTYSAIKLTEGTLEDLVYYKIKSSLLMSCLKKNTSNQTIISMTTNSDNTYSFPSDVTITDIIILNIQSETNIVYAIYKED